MKRSAIAVMLLCLSTLSFAQPGRNRLPTQTFELACPAGYSPLAPYGTTLDTKTGLWRANMCIATDGSGRLVCQMDGCGSQGASGGIPTVGTPAASPAAVTSINLFGDSIAAGTGVQTATQTFGQLVANGLGLTLSNNYGVAGVRMTGFLAQALPVTTSAAVGSIAIMGANEVASVKANGSFQADYIAGVMDFAVWLGTLPAQQKTVAAGIAFSGSWTDFGSYEGLHIKFAHSIGATATATVTGSTVYVGNFVSTSGDFNLSYTVTIDGVLKDTLSNVSSTASQYPRCARYAGLSSGSHTVVITSTSNSNSQVAPVQFIAGSGGASPFVWLGTTLPLIDSTNDATIASMNSALATLVGQLQSDGLNIRLTDTHAALSLTANPVQYVTDATHPNELGNMLLAQKMFLDVFNGSVPGGVNAQSLVSYIQRFLNKPPAVSTATPSGGRTSAGFKGELATDGSFLYINTGPNLWGSIPIQAFQKAGGTCAMSSGTSCTFSLPVAYNTAMCLATEQGTGALAGSCGVSGTTVTITAASSNSATWAAMVWGNPN